MYVIALPYSVCDEYPGSPHEYPGSPHEYPALFRVVLLSLCLP